MRRSLEGRRGSVSSERDGVAATGDEVRADRGAIGASGPRVGAERHAIGTAGDVVQPERHAVGSNARVVPLGSGRRAGSKRSFPRVPQQPGAGAGSAESAGTKCASGHEPIDVAEVVGAGGVGGHHSCRTGVAGGTGRSRETWRARRSGRSRRSRRPGRARQPGHQVAVA